MPSGESDLVQHDPKGVSLVATNYSDLVPRDVAREVVQQVADSQSALMQLATIVRMPSGVEAVPVVGSAPVSGFVSPARASSRPGQPAPDGG
jgi:hypothetical protein